MVPTIVKKAFVLVVAGQQGLDHRRTDLPVNLSNALLNSPTQVRNGKPQEGSVILEYADFVVLIDAKPLDVVSHT